MSSVAKCAARTTRAAAFWDVDWAGVARDLDARGFAIVRNVLPVETCVRLRGWYGDDGLFRSRIAMTRHGFGQGEYQYFAYPLPDSIENLRQTLYAHLAPIADGWARALGGAARYPTTLAAFLKTCHEAGQSRPTPLMLKYGPGDHNRLHQDLYGGVQFPLQATVLLSAPGAEFDGGEFVLTETAPRRQTRVEVVALGQGDMVIFAVNHRPVRSAKGFSRVAMRHGVSTVRRGARMTLGIILHDAA